MSCSSADLSLEKATSENVVYVHYKSGACYKGQVEENKRAGRGLFAWPNGATYDGEFYDNVRQGRGKQVFKDGTVYEGDYDNDLRHGQGTITWSNGEVYCGRFFKDRRHGYGVYTWPDGSKYSGTFYINMREGYGTLTYNDGTVFQGLYARDERFGPGVQTYADGREDVGIWCREQLLKLCLSHPGAFLLRNYPHLDYEPNDVKHKAYIHPGYLQNHMEVLDPILHPPEPFDYPPKTERLENKIKQEVFYDREVDVRSVAADLATWDAVFFEEAIRTRQERKILRSAKKHGRDSVKKNLKGSISEAGVMKSPSPAFPALAVHQSAPTQGASPTQVSARSSIRFTDEMDDAGLDTDSDDEDAPVAIWNKTPLLVRIQKNIVRHRPGEKHVKFDVDSIVRGDRAEFGPSGPLELESLDYLRWADEGNEEKIYDTIVAGRVHINVADQSGHYAFLGATINWELPTCDVLLSSGADIDQLTDEGVSALTASMLFLYPPSRFQWNIAENGLEDPPEGFPKEPGFEVAATQVQSRGKGGKNSPKEVKDKKKPMSASKTPPRDLELEKTLEGSKHTLGVLRINKAVKISEINTTYNAAPDPTESLIDPRPTSEDITSDKTAFSLDPANVSAAAIDRAASNLSHNSMVTGRPISDTEDSQLNIIERAARDMRKRALMEETVKMVVTRGGNPNSSAIPMPAIFYCTKAGDTEMVRLLLSHGAYTSSRLADRLGALTPLHIAAALPPDEGIKIAKLLLDALANPDAKAEQDEMFLNKKLEEEWAKDLLSTDSLNVLGGRTPLHIACARDDSYNNAAHVVDHLLDHHANTALIVNGHSALALAIASGNDKAVRKLLDAGVDANQPLTHGIGTALCVAATTEYEHRRSPEQRIALIDKLLDYGADILAPVPIGPKRQPGTVVDFAHYMFNQDKRIAHMPYHALSYVERETYNARKMLLQHLADRLREAAVAREKERRLLEESRGAATVSPSAGFLYTGAGREATDTSFNIKGSKGSKGSAPDIRRPLFKFCYECGRVVGVRLEPCSRCKEVYYCSKACKTKGWNARHKDECVRLAGRDTSAKRHRGAAAIHSEKDIDSRKAHERGMKLEDGGILPDATQSAPGGERLGSPASGRRGQSPHERGSSGRSTPDKIMSEGSIKGRRGVHHGSRHDGDSKRVGSGHGRDGRGAAAAASRARSEGAGLRKSWPTKSTGGGLATSASRARHGSIGGAGQSHSQRYNKPGGGSKAAVSQGRAGGLQGQAGGLHGQAGGMHGQAGGLHGQAGGLHGQAGGLHGKFAGSQGRAGDVGSHGRTAGFQGQVSGTLGKLTGSQIKPLWPSGMGQAGGLAPGTARQMGTDLGKLGLYSVGAYGVVAPALQSYIQSKAARGTPLGELVARGVNVAGLLAQGISLAQILGEEGVSWQGYLPQITLLTRATELAMMGRLPSRQYDYLGSLVLPPRLNPGGSQPRSWGSVVKDSEDYGQWRVNLPPYHVPNGLVIDPVSGLVQKIDPSTGTITWVDNYSNN